MASGSFKLPLATIGGLSVILFFCIFTLAAVALFPGPFAPTDNWISDLGAPLMNPAGDVYFNSGCIITGACMLLLMAGLSAWYTEGGWKKAFMVAGQLCGVISAFGLMLVGVFNESSAYHDTISIIFFLFLCLFLIFTTISLWKHLKFIRWIGYYALVVVIIELAFMYTYFAYDHAPFWEWLAVFSALLWVALLAFNTLYLQ